MRDFIDKKEGKLIVIRFIGFCLMIIGVIALVICAFLRDDRAPNMMAISFFITMLGFSLAFPSLLEGNEGLSTMRIVVFMTTNVICMLLIRVGWRNATTSLADIKLDGYWVALIAFVFGAQAAQSFSESRMAVAKVKDSFSALPDEPLSADVARLGVLQHQELLKTKFSNILTVSDAVCDLSKTDSHVIAIYLKDNQITGLPSQLEVSMPDGTVKLINTEIIKSSGVPRIQLDHTSSEISAQPDMDYPGSVCCAVRSVTDQNFRGLVTAAHIHTRGIYQPYNGVLNPVRQTDVFVNGSRCGYWIYEVLNATQDLAVVALPEEWRPDGDFLSFSNKFYDIEDKDVRTARPNVRLAARNNRIADGYIIDRQIGLDVEYLDGSYYKKNLILISANRDRQSAKPISDDGDSGGCVYHQTSGELIGILLGTANNFSLVLPIRETLQSFNLITV